MKKTFKKLLSILMVFAMLIGMVPTQAFAAEEQVDFGWASEDATNHTVLWNKDAIDAGDTGKVWMSIVKDGVQIGGTHTTNSGSFDIAGYIQANGTGNYRVTMNDDNENSYYTTTKECLFSNKLSNPDVSWNDNVAQWTAVSSADGYTFCVYYKSDSTAAPELLKTRHLEASETSKDMTPFMLDAGIYYFTVQATTKDTTVDYSDVVKSTEKNSDGLVKAPLSNFRLGIAANGEDPQKVYWDAYPGASQYWVLVMKDGTQITGTYTTGCVYDLKLSELGAGSYSVEANAVNSENQIISEDTGISFEYTPESTPTTYEVTFDANGGSVDPSKGTTGTDGKLTSLPTPTTTDTTKEFDAWYDAATGGNKVTTDTVFTTSTTIYAHWKDKAPATTLYNVWVAGTQVTSENKDDILGLGNGEASYDPATNTLTVKKDISSTTEHAIEAETEADFTVDVEGKVKMDTGNGIEYTGDGMMTVIGDELIMDVGGNAVYSGNDLKIECKKLDIDSGTYGIYSGSGDVVINNTQINISRAGYAGIVTPYGDVTVNNKVLNITGAKEAILVSEKGKNGKASLTSEEIILSTGQTSIEVIGNCDIKCKNLKITSKWNGTHIVGDLNISADEIIVVANSDGLRTTKEYNLTIDCDVMDIQSTRTDEDANFYALSCNGTIKLPKDVTVIAATEVDGEFEEYDIAKNATYDHVKIDVETINVTYDYESKEDVVKQFAKGVSIYDAAVESAPPADTKPGYVFHQWNLSADTPLENLSDPENLSSTKLIGDVTFVPHWYKYYDEIHFSFSGYEIGANIADGELTDDIDGYAPLDFPELWGGKNFVIVADKDGIPDMTDPSTMLKVVTGAFEGNKDYWLAVLIGGEGRNITGDIVLDAYDINDYFLDSPDCVDKYHYGYGEAEIAFFKLKPLAEPTPSPSPSVSPSVTLDKATLTLTVGETATLTPTISPDNLVCLVEWTSSDDAIATVENGVVTAVAEGTATVTVTLRPDIMPTSEETTAYPTATCVVTVTEDSGNTGGDTGDSEDNGGGTGGSTTPTTPSAPSTPSVPDTSDNTGTLMYLTSLICAAAALVAVVIYRRKKAE